MGESKSQFAVAFDREVASLQQKLRRKTAPSIREIVEKTQNPQFKKKLIELVAPLKAASPSGRYPTVAQVRKMLAANDNYGGEVRDYSEISAEYEKLFEQCLTESGDVNVLVSRLAKDSRIDAGALAAVTAALTGKPATSVTAKSAKLAIFDEFAHRSVTLMAKRAARSAKPF